MSYVTNLSDDTCLCIADATIVFGVKASVLSRIGYAAS